MSSEAKDTQMQMVLLYADAYQMLAMFKVLAAEFPNGFDGNDYFSRSAQELKNSVNATQEKMERFLIWLVDTKEIGYTPFDDSTAENAKEFLDSLQADIYAVGYGWEGMRILAADPTLFPNRKFTFTTMQDECKKIRESFD